jgi:hypothetical protein
VFTKEDGDVWAGGYYGLAFELGPSSDARLQATMYAVWSFARLDGCYLRSDVEPADQAKLTPSLTLLEEQSQLYCVVTLPEGCRVAAGVTALRGFDGGDWFDISVPMGALDSEVGLDPVLHDAYYSNSPYFVDSPLGSSRT